MTRSVNLGIVRTHIKNGTHDSLRETVHACGLRSTGAIEFTAVVLADNKGLKLRRMLDHASADIPVICLLDRRDSMDHCRKRGQLLYSAALPGTSPPRVRAWYGP